MFITAHFLGDKEDQPSGGEGRHNDGGGGIAFV